MSFKFDFLVGSAAFFFIHSTYYVFIWRTIIGRLGVQLTFIKAWRLFVLGEFFRYIPGKIWQFLGRAHLCKREGISEEQTTISMIIEICLNMTAGVLTLLCSLLFWYEETLPIVIYWVFIVPPAISVFLYPSIFTKLVNRALRLIGREEVGFHLRYKDLLLFSGMYFLSWWVVGFAWFLFINSFYNLNVSFYPVVTGIVAISWVIGILSFLTPTGIGVREGVFSFLFSSFVPVSIAILASIAMRVWSTIIELILGVIAFTTSRRNVEVGSILTKKVF